MATSRVSVTCKAGGVEDADGAVAAATGPIGMTRGREPRRHDRAGRTAPIPAFDILADRGGASAGRASPCRAQFSQETAIPWPADRAHRAHISRRCRALGLTGVE